MLTSIEKVTKAIRLAGGILKLPIFLCRVVPCLTNKVFTCASITHGTKVETKIGNILTICLVSSTCVTEHSIHELVEPAFTAALLRNLQFHTNMSSNSYVLYNNFKTRVTKKKKKKQPKKNKQKKEYH